MLIDYASLGSLDKRIERGYGISGGGTTLTRFYVACLISAIEHMHKVRSFNEVATMLINLPILQRGVVHRDIKPSNILLDDSGYVKLCDYGLSKFLPIGERTNSFVGTLAYLPPYMIDREPYGHSCDLWSLGITAYECLYGRTPFDPLNLLDDKTWKVEIQKNIRTAQLVFPSWSSKVGVNK